MAHTKKHLNYSVRVYYQKSSAPVAKIKVYVIPIQYFLMKYVISARVVINKNSFEVD